MNWTNEGPADEAVGITDDFRITLGAGRATVEVLANYSTVDEARGVVEPFLRAWEIQAFLRHVARHDDFQQPLVFEFESADVANPVREPEKTIHLKPAKAFHYHAYPPSPDRFKASPDVQSMWLRWQEYQAGRESLPSMAYFCLTVVEASVGARKERRKCAADVYAIDIEVLNTMGDLVSEVGEAHELRKAHAREKRPYSPAEREWIELVTLTLVRRVGEVAYLATAGAQKGEPLPPITFSDFPALK